MAIHMTALLLAINRNIYYLLVSLVLNFAVFWTMSLALYMTDFVTLKTPNSSYEEDSQTLTEDQSPSKRNWNWLEVYSLLSTIIHKSKSSENQMIFH